MASGLAAVEDMTNGREGADSFLKVRELDSSIEELSLKEAIWIDKDDESNL
jgi:hypothetical protein